MALVFEPSLIQRQKTVTTFFTAALSQGKLAHAYLFVGGNTADKWLVARQIALYLNCTDDQKESHGSCAIRTEDNEKRCQSCRWIAEGKHPQAWFELKEAESTSTVIPVERARQISQELVKTSNYKRIIVVEDANQDVFHRPAANALLKTIEEPRGVCLFFFFARTVEQVLATIVSRCQTIPFALDGKTLLGPLHLVGQGNTGLIARFLGVETELVGTLESMKERKFFDWSRNRKHHGNYTEVMSEGEKVIAIKDALDFGKMINDLIDEDHDAYAIIDGAVLTEIEIIGTKAHQDARLSSYLRRLLTLAEETKMQLRRYVTKKAAVDSFVVDWSDLRSKIVS